MFESRPELKDAFQKFKGKNLTELQHTGLIRAHALRVMATVDKCISRLDEPSNLANLMIEMGRHHRQYNVNPDYIQVGSWDKFYTSSVKTGFYTTTMSTSWIIVKYLDRGSQPDI